MYLKKGLGLDCGCRNPHPSAATSRTRVANKKSLIPRWRPLKYWMFWIKVVGRGCLVTLAWQDHWINSAVMTNELKLTYHIYEDKRRTLVPNIGKPQIFSSTDTEWYPIIGIYVRRLFPRMCNLSGALVWRYQRERERATTLARCLPGFEAPRE